MSRCTRFESEAIVLIERGETLDPHFDQCVDCKAARAQYDRLTSAIGRLDDELEPSSDWQQRVMREIEAATTQQPGPARWWLGGAALAASVLMATWVFNAGQSPGVGLTHELFESDVVYRGVNAKPGDALQLNGAVGRADYSELRLYLDDNSLVFSCGDAPECDRDGDGITGRATLTARGTYQGVLLMSEQPIPPATGALDSDVLAAREAGGQVVMGEAIDVR